MLYVLPPPRAPDPPSPWDSILCTSGTSNNQNVSDRTSWEINQMKPPLGAKNFNNKLRKIEAVKAQQPNEKDDSSRTNKSLSECYFAGKGTATVLVSTTGSGHERPRPRRRPSAPGSDIQQHLQSMFYLLRPEETLKMAVKLESAHPYRTRYLVVVSRVGDRSSEESCLLGIDCNDKTTIGLVLRVLADTTITLDGDGGFSVSVCGRHHIFKPVSVQAMWSALQTLHKISSKAREQNYFEGGPSHEWVSYYNQKIESDRSCLNEWYAMDNLESRRPPSPNSIRTKPTEREEAEMIIRSTLKEIMMSVDLDEVTSKCIRNRLEEDLNMNLGEFKSFIDQEIITILGQMDAPTEIFDHVYLGSEWNASNFEELQKNGVGHILNVTREIDNFFPGMFDYLNIRVLDDEKTDLLKHWDNTFKYITKAKNKGSKVLVHCKMGVSRSASVVIAYAMKAYNWDFQKALTHVKEKRTCIKPNKSFITQLETYQGILDAMKNKDKLQRSKSETNLKNQDLKIEKKLLEIGESNIKNFRRESKSLLLIKHISVRSKSWSPDYRNTIKDLENSAIPMFYSLENLNQPQKRRKNLSNFIENARNVLMPLNNGQSYSVSPNQIVHIPGSIKKITEIKGKVLNLTSQFESDKKISENSSSQTSNDLKVSIGQLNLHKTWDPGEKNEKTIPENIIWTSSSVLKQQGHSSELQNDLNINLKTQETQTSVKKCDTDLLSKFHPEIILKQPDLINITSNFSGIKKLDTEISPNATKNDVTSKTDNTITSLYPQTKKNSPILSKKSDTSLDSLLQQQTEDFKKSEVSSPILRKVITNEGAKVLVRKDGDPFSNRLDKVFDREERKSSNTRNDEERKCPSRQSSWSSYDSAVVLGYQGESREAPSRHSSWGSGDTRTLPSRNSSWGSYDMRRSHIGQTIITEKDDKADILSTSSSGIFPYDKDEIPWYPGTVKRTKQKLENTEKSNPKTFDSTQSTPSIEILRDLSPKTRSKIDHYQSSPALCSKKCSDKEMVGENARLSVSAPGSSNLCVIEADFAIEQTKNKIKNLSEEHKHGLVKNLKKEFESKTTEDKEKTNPQSPKIENEDISVKELVGKYEVFDTSPILRHKCIYNNKNNRHSCIEVLSSQKEQNKSPQSTDLKSLDSTRPKSAYFPINNTSPLSSTVQNKFTLPNKAQKSPSKSLKLPLSPNGQLNLKGININPPLKLSPTKISAKNVNLTSNSDIILSLNPPLDPPKSQLSPKTPNSPTKNVVLSLNPTVEGHLSSKNPNSVILSLNPTLDDRLSPNSATKSVILSLNPPLEGQLSPKSLSSPSKNVNNSLNPVLVSPTKNINLTLNDPKYLNPILNKPTSPTKIVNPKEAIKCNGPLNNSILLNNKVSPTKVQVQSGIKGDINILKPGTQPLSSFVKSSVVKAAAKKQLRNRDFSNLNNVKLKNNSHNTM